MNLPTSGLHQNLSEHIDTDHLMSTIEQLVWSKPKTSELLWTAGHTPGREEKKRNPTVKTVLRDNPGWLATANRDEL